MVLSYNCHVARKCALSNRLKCNIYFMWWRHHKHTKGKKAKKPSRESLNFMASFNPRICNEDKRIRHWFFFGLQKLLKFVSFNGKFSQFFQLNMSTNFVELCGLFKFIKGPKSSMLVIDSGYFFSIFLPTKPFFLKHQIFKLGFLNSINWPET